MATTLNAPINKPVPRFFYGWFIVAFSTLAMVVSNGLAVGGLPIFFKPMTDELLSLGAITEARSFTGTIGGVTFLVGGLFAPVAGWLTTKVNLRVLMTAGCIFLGSGLLLYSRATTAGPIYLAHALFGLALCLIGLLANTVLISHWFRSKRGLAMGLVLTGTSLGGALIPQLALPFIKNPAYGWRTGILFVSALVWVVLLPAIWLVVRVHPGEAGLWPDGAAAPAEEVQDAPLTGYTLGEALRTPDFWAFAVVALGLFYAIITVIQQVILYLQSPAIGMNIQQAGNVQTTLTLMSVAGKFFFGNLSDRLPKSLVLLLCASVMLLGTLVLLILSGSTAYLFAIPFGIAFGGSVVSIQVLAVERFGLKEAGKIIGAITLVETLGGAAGLFATGKLAQKYGYGPAFKGVIIATAIALAASFVLHKLVSRTRRQTAL